MGYVQRSEHEERRNHAKDIQAGADRNAHGSYCPDRRRRRQTDHDVLTTEEYDRARGNEADAADNLGRDSRRVRGSTKAVDAHKAEKARAHTHHDVRAQARRLVLVLALKADQRAEAGCRHESQDRLQLKTHRALDRAAFVDFCVSPVPAAPSPVLLRTANRRLSAFM